MLSPEHATWRIDWRARLHVIGASGFSLGDEVVFGGGLQRPDGTQVGRYGAVCTFVSAANADRVEAQCPATATLPRGQITVQGVVVNRSLNVTLPIIGGSGQFQGADGQVVQRDVSSGTQLKVELTFHLEGLQLGCVRRCGQV